MELVIRLVNNQWHVIWQAKDKTDTEIICNDFGAVLGELIEFRDTIKNLTYPNDRL